MRMKSGVAVIVLIACASWASMAQDKVPLPQVRVSGQWAGEIRTAVSYSPIQVSFKLEDTTKGVTGFAWPGEGQVPITNVKYEGATLAFEVSGEDAAYRFSLTVGAERMEGDVSVDDHGHSWTGKVRLNKEQPKENEKK
ncbi:MAG TPA: hypothetical protein VGK32_08445 [Vicinamibacterales bacterium]